MPLPKDSFVPAVALSVEVSQPQLANACRGQFLFWEATMATMDRPGPCAECIEAFNVRCPDGHCTGIAGEWCDPFPKGLHWTHAARRTAVESLRALGLPVPGKWTCLPARIMLTRDVRYPPGKAPVVGSAIPIAGPSNTYIPPLTDEERAALREKADVKPVQPPPPNVGACGAEDEEDAQQEPAEAEKGVAS